MCPIVVFGTETFGMDQVWLSAPPNLDTAATPAVAARVVDSIGMGSTTLALMDPEEADESRDKPQ